MGGFAVNVISGLGLDALNFLRGYRPLSWVYGGPKTTALTVRFPTTNVSTRIDTGQGTTPTPGSGTTSYTTTTFYFDSVLRLDHEQELTVTSHPIQSGASIADHAYLMAPRVTLEVGMTDLMASYSPGQWAGNKSRSVAAFQMMDQIQRQRLLCTLTTRLKTYENMILKILQAPDDVRTFKGLRMTIGFFQVLTAVVTTTPSSSRPNSTASSSIGSVAPISVPPSIPTLGLP